MHGTYFYDHRERAQPGNPGIRIMAYQNLYFKNLIRFNK
jgi:hypothetical protein